MHMVQTLVSQIWIWETRIYVNVVFPINLNRAPSSLTISFTKRHAHLVITFAIFTLGDIAHWTKIAGVLRPFNRRRRKAAAAAMGKREGGWSRERGREDSLRRPQLKRGPATERVQLPTGNGIPLFPGTMIRYVAVWITHNITPAGLVRGGCIRRESVGRGWVGSGWARTPRNMKFKNPQIEGGCI